MELLTNSPLIEASCEIIFMPSKNYDTTIPGMVYGAVRSDYPIKKEKNGMANAPNLQEPTSIDLIPSPLTQFYSPTEKDVIQISKDLLVFNRLAPYPGWDTFKREILRVLNIYQDCFNEPLEIRKATLKYINSLRFPKDADFDQIFDFPMPNPRNKKYQKNKAFQIVVEYDTEYHDVLGINFRSVRDPDQAFKACNLEFLNINITPQKVSLTDFGGWLDKAHKTVEDAFVASFKKVFYHNKLK